MNNIFNLDNIDFLNNEEITEILLQGKKIRIERIISSGQVSPEDFWHDQSDHEFVMVLQGEAKILFEDNKEQFLTQGDYLIIPAHLKHRVSYTSFNPKCIWLTLFYELA